jgi:hypothetical protein
MISPFGYRSLIFLSPLTLILAGEGLYLLWIKMPAKKLFIMTSLIFPLFMAVYGVKTMLLYASTTDLTLNTADCTNFLKLQFDKGNNVFFTSMDSINYYLNQNLDKFILRGINTATDKLIHQRDNFVVTEDPTIFKPGYIDMSLSDNMGITSRLENLIKVDTTFRCKGYIIVKLPKS